MKRSSLLCLVFVVLFGCKRGSELDGFEKWRFGETTAEDGVVCTPSGELTFCSQNRPVQVAGYTGSVNLYFTGHGKDAPLAEIEVAFNRCDPRKIGAAFMERLGPPGQKRGDGAYWELKRMNLAARLPADDGTCLVNFVRPDDKARWAELTSQK